MKNRKNNSQKIWSKTEKEDYNTGKKMKKNNTVGKEVMKSKECECCIRCHKHLNIPVELEIDYRPFYVEGAGQLCYDCYHEIYG